jgi:cholesterol transport system auxiliary component
VVARPGAPRLVATLLALATLGGCALLGKSEPLVPRFYAAQPAAEAAPARAPPGLQLRLGRVEGAAHLRERMVVRRAGQELAYREDRRWTERPEAYLRRALAQTLFEGRGLVEGLTGRAVTLDVELEAFEEVEQDRAVRLRVRLVLRDERVALLRETIVVEQPVAGGTGAVPVVEALTGALREGVSRAADLVVARLAAPGAAATPAAP